MALLLPAIKGKLGDITYYSLTMKGRELTQKVAIPREQPRWDDQEFGDYFQRKINYKRVRTGVAHYFASNDFRFSSAVIVAVKDFANKVSFTPLTGGLSQTGLLTIDGSCQLWPVDGQHRVLAIQYAINGKDRDGVKIRGLQPNEALAEEEIPVLLIPFELERVRAIFSAVNENAQGTSASENALVGGRLTQELARYVATMVFSVRLIEKDVKTLKEDHKLTTLTTVEKGVKHILDALYPGLRRTYKTSDKIDPNEYVGIRDRLVSRWEALASNIDFYQAALEDKSYVGDRKRALLKQNCLISRTIVQEHLFKAFGMLINANGRFYSNHNQAAQALNKLPLNRDDIAKWQPFLFNAKGRIESRHKKFIPNLMVYLVTGDHYRQKEELEKQYAEFFPDQKNKKLPPPVV